MSEAPMGRGESLALRIALQFETWAFVAADPAAPSLERRPGPGAWCAREHLAHAGRMHEIYLERVARILGETAPALPRYRAEEDPGWPAWRDLAVVPVLERAFARREELVRKVQPLSDTELRRSGAHAALGPMALSAWLELFLAHEGHHLYRAVLLSRGA